MEAVGAFRIFERSLIKRDLQYTEYYGDGDSKGFLQVKDIYGENSVTKLECIGHIQKRVGSRLRKLKKNTKGLGGKGKLTDKFIDKLQNYYWIAIRSNVGCLEKIQSAVIAAFFHCCSSNQNPMHGQCPTGKDRWCKYKQALSDGKLYVDKTESGKSSNSRHHCGPKKLLRERDQRRLMRIINRGRRVALPQIAADFNAEPSTGVTACQRRHWTVDDWTHVAWSDKSSFQLNRADGRVRVWRQPPEPMDPTCQQGTVQAGGGFLML
ncbi:uncharacterized protein TNCV_3313001 [Trichonephila clavipes]|nr:uncharacterized protein TNCV_3313001 [Trichonephila clavipes]